ncbi:hypothetical protein [Amycolatopsis sp. RTGN1]|uniref:hypothetical protein n=1 Tax=Amycolatopsis ponsaeliensis TaxID=2992142 RepID=UPI00254B4D06|nr:hypothetical protein [Amycolatopsis sp. RTGN1]
MAGALTLDQGRAVRLVLEHVVDISGSLARGFIVLRDISLDLRPLAEARIQNLGRDLDPRLLQDQQHICARDRVFENARRLVFELEQAERGARAIVRLFGVDPDIEISSKPDLQRNYLAVRDLNLGFKDGMFDALKGIGSLARELNEHLHADQVANVGPRLTDHASGGMYFVRRMESVISATYFPVKDFQRRLVRMHSRVIELSNGTRVAKMSQRLTSCAVRLLPVFSRAEYDEVFRSELLEMTESGCSWLGQVRHALRVLVRAPLLALTLRSGPPTDRGVW